jgi:hypothetical protein
MMKKIWFIITLFLFQGCTEFIDAIDNIQLPTWETEMSFHILEENIRLSEKFSGDAFIAYDCTDTTLCDTSRGRIYMIEISDSIGTIQVGDQLEFEDIHQEFEQSIDDVEIAPVSTNLITEIGTISLGEMPSQNTPLITFRDIMDSGTIELAENLALANESGGKNTINIPTSSIAPTEQLFSFSSFSEAEIYSSTIDITITNNMFITLGEPITIELMDTLGIQSLGQVIFNDKISTNNSSTESLNLNGVILPGTIKIIVTGNTSGTEDEEYLIQSSDLDSGFFISITVNEMEVLSATANIPEQALTKSGKFALAQSSSQVQLVNAEIEFGLLDLIVENGISLASILEISIPGLTNEDGQFTTSFQIEEALGNTPSITNPNAESLSGYTLSLAGDSLEYFYTVTTIPDSVNIDHTDQVNVELNIHGPDENTGLTFTSIEGFFNEVIENSSQIELASETRLESAVIDSGQMSLSIINGLGLNAEIKFIIDEFLDIDGNSLESIIELNGPTIIHVIDLNGYTIQLSAGSINGVNPQMINYTSTVTMDTTLQEIAINGGLTVNVDITGLKFESVSGIINPVSMDQVIEFPIELPNAIDEFSEQLSGFNFYRSDFELVIESSIEVPMEIGLSLKSYRTTIELDDTIEPTYLDSASYDTILIVNPSLDKNTFNLTNTENLLNIFPNKISATVHAEVGGGNESGLITQNSELSGNITVKIPLAFIIEDTILLDLDMQQLDPLDELANNVQHAEITSIISSNFGLNFDISAYVYSDTLDTIPLDTLLANLAMKGGETIENISELDNDLFTNMIENKTYIKPIITIMGNYDDNGDPIPFIIYSTDSLKLDIIAKTSILVDSTLTNSEGN